MQRLLLGILYGAELVSEDLQVSHQGVQQFIHLEEQDRCHRQRLAQWRPDRKVPINQPC